MTKLSKLARSPQGRKALDQAQTYAKSEQGQRQVQKLRSKLLRGGKGR